MKHLWKWAVGAVVVGGGLLLWQKQQEAATSAMATTAAANGIPLTGSPGTTYLSGGYQATYGATGALAALGPAPTAG